MERPTRRRRRSMSLCTVALLVTALPAVGLVATPAAAAGPVLIPAVDTVGPASPYPLELPVSGLSGVVSDVDVVLTGITHELWFDLEMLLVAPDGTTRSLLWARAGTEFVGEPDPVVDVVFDDEASADIIELQDASPYRVRPTNASRAGDDVVLPAPAPDGVAPTSLAVFDGIDPNGTWLLYIADGFEGHAGGRLEDATLDITTTEPVAIPGGGTEGSAAVYPIDVPVSGFTGAVTDLDVRLTRLAHAAPEDLDVLLVAPDGVTRSWLLSDAGGPSPVDMTLTVDDEAAPLDGPLAAGSVRPVNDVPDDVLPAPAPPGPAPASLAVFDGLDPNGTWTLYVFDDDPGGGAGRLVDVSLELTAGPIRLPGDGTIGRAARYPIQIPVAGHTGLVSDVNVHLSGLSHERPEDLDFVLVAPDGVTASMFLSDAGGSAPVVDVDLVIDNAAADEVPFAFGPGTYRPTDPEHFVGDPEVLSPAPFSRRFDDPAPDILEVFNGINPNGTWTLWIVDDDDGAAGSLDGVTLDITTAPVIAIPGSGTEGPASTYPLEIPVTGQTGPIRDVNVVLQGLTHTAPIDLDVLLVAPDGVTRSWLMSDAGGIVDIANLLIVIDDEAAGPMPTALDEPLFGGTYRPTNDGPDDVLPAPAPAGPAPTSLSVFDGLDPNGTWTLYLFDDEGNDVGHVTNAVVDVTTGVRIPASGGDPGVAEPYPLAIPVAGHTGRITDVNVRLDDLTQRYPTGLDMLLVAPDGQTRSFIWSDAGGGPLEDPVIDLDIVLDDEASDPVPQFDLVDGTYMPTNFIGDREEETGDDLPAPAPDPVNAPTGLSVFDGLDPNGTWNLYIENDAFAFASTLGNVTLDITTAIPAAIPATGSTGPADPYPIRIPVSDHTGTIADVNIVVDRLVHASAQDVDMLLVAPDGRTRSWLMSDAGGALPVDARFVLDDEAAGAVPTPVTPGTYRPTNANTDERLPRPGPQGRIATTSLAAFDGLDPNGTWTLYVFDDDTSGGSGVLAGVSLDIATAVRIPATGIAGAAEPYPLEIPVRGRRGVVEDVDVTIEGLEHTFPTDVDILLVAPDGTTRSWLLSDQPPGFENDGRGRSVDLVIDDEAPGPVPFAGPLSSGTYQPSDQDEGDGDLLPAPAPQGPAAASLAEFDGVDPNGTWRVYIVDDRVGPPSGQSNGGSGTIGAVSLDITTAPRTDIGPSGQTRPYPIRIPVSGITAPVTDLDVELARLQHANAADLDMLLVAPDGVTRSWLLSDTGGNRAVDARLFIDDEATDAAPSPLVAGRYRPTNVVADDVLPRPAPAGAAPASLAVFEGIDPNGTWTLYVYDDAPGRGGSLGNVRLHFSAGVQIPGSGTSGPASPYPFLLPISGLTGTVSDLDVQLDGFSHTFPSDVAFLLVAPDGVTRSWLLAEAGGSTSVAGVDLVIDDEAPGPVPFTLTTGSYQPTGSLFVDLPAPAPPGAAPTSLAAFDGIDPNGVWNLYIVDLFGGDAGRLDNATLVVTTTP